LETVTLSPELITLLSTLLSFVIGILARQPAFQKFKSKTKMSKSFIEEIDNALYDDKVTDEEFRKIFDSGRKLVNEE